MLWSIAKQREALYISSKYFARVHFTDHGDHRGKVFDRPGFRYAAITQQFRCWPPQYAEYPSLQTSIALYQL